MALSPHVSQFFYCAPEYPASPKGYGRTCRADADFVGFASLQGVDPASPKGYGRTGPASPANLHQLGIDHTQLTYKFQGRHYRLTDVHGDVIHEILA